MIVIVAVLCLLVIDDDNDDKRRQSSSSIFVHCFVPFVIIHLAMQCNRCLNIIVTN